MCKTLCSNNTDVQFVTIETTDLTCSGCFNTGHDKIKKVLI